MGLRGPVVVALLAVAAAAQDWPKELPAAGREALQRDGVWVGPREFKQVFEAYNDPPCPIFVSTDGPIVAGYRLMERTVMRMERWSFVQLPGDLRLLEAKLSDAAWWVRLPDKTAAAATRRARLVVAVARLLLGENPGGLDDATLADARACAELVEKAEGLSMPPGLGPPDPGWLGFEWKTFRPRGPYAGEAWMERAFRATRWLQAVPFRLERDEEVAAFWILREATRNAWFRPSPMWAKGLVPLTEERSAYTEALDEFFVIDGLDAAEIEELRADLRKGIGGRMSTDLLHETRRGDEVRLLPRIALPEDDILFAQLHPPGQEIKGAGFPAGLTVAAALGSPLAREPALRTPFPATEARASLGEGEGWVADAHRMRAALLDAAEPDAPALFSSPAWQRKSLRTALGSWALERNVWTLHGGPAMAVFGGPKQLPGLVEPDPEAFGRLAAMGRSVLAWTGGEELDGRAMRVDYADGVLGDTRTAIRNLVDPNGFPPPEWRFLSHLREIGVLTPEEYRKASEGLTEDSEGVRKRWRQKGEPEGDVEAEIRAVRARLDPVLAACERWHARVTDPSAQAREPFRGKPLRPEWEHWIELCTRLELLAHKQLRQQPWSEEDKAFLKHYGTELAGLMGYPPGSLEHAEDDAPRAAPVVCDPSNGVMRVVGTGRPRELWVLYPFRGEKVLCRGVVLSYYEIDAKDAPTDAEWKSMLGSEEPPREPKWLTGE